MAKRHITPEQARELHALITRYGSIAAAFAECTISLTAMAPYTDRRLSEIRDLLYWMNGRSNQERLVEQIAEMAAKARAEALR